MVAQSSIFKVEKNLNYEITVVSKEKILNASIKEDTEFGKIKINKQKKIFYYYNWELEKITVITNSTGKCTITIKKKHITINQIYVAKHLSHFENEIRSQYNLAKYNNEYLPAIFFGILSEYDIKILKNNKSLKIIVWTGGDIYIDHENKNHVKRVSNNINIIKNIKRIKHVSISKFIENDLKKLGLSYINFPFSAINLCDYEPVIKGKCIYIYTSPFYPEKYGEELYSKIIDKYPNINFIITCNKESYAVMLEHKDKIKSKYELKCYSKDELLKVIYPQCFLGLRLTNHDGLAGSVIELGAMGIKSIHNGYSPSSLNYTNFDDICNHIDNEIKTVGTCDVELSENIKKYVKADPNFFNTSYYHNK